MRPVIALVAVFLIALPSVSALNCTRFEGYEEGWCIRLNSSHFGEEHREMFMSFVLGPNINIPAYKTLSDLNKERIDLEGETDKFYYRDGEEISLIIYPTDLPVNVRYGSQEKTARESTTLTAEYPTNQITLTYRDTEESVFISTSDSKKILTAWKIFLFGFFNYVLFSFVTKSRFLAQWLSVA